MIIVANFISDILLKLFVDPILIYVQCYLASSLILLWLPVLFVRKLVRVNIVIMNFLYFAIVRDIVSFYFCCIVVIFP